MFTVSAGFIGNFKLGDNINHNLNVLAYLYERQADEHDDEACVLRKTNNRFLSVQSPKQFFMTSISECIRILSKE